MKKLIILFSALLFFSGSCKKQAINVVNTQMTAAPPLTYIILDKNGKNIIISSHDSLAITYNNSPNKQFYDYILDVNMLQGTVPRDYSQFIKKYNGVEVLDSKMVQLNAGIGSPYPLSMISPVHTFNLNLNGKNLGTIYLNTIQQHSNWQEAKEFTFNDTPVKIDSTTGVIVYVIQLQ